MPGPWATEADSLELGPPPSLKLCQRIDIEGVCGCGSSVGKAS